MKTGFGTQLFKGFVRSAVNQVGRDGGRVISNKIYGDSHATKVQGVGGQESSNVLENLPPVSETVELVGKDGSMVIFQNGQVPNGWVLENFTPVIYQSSALSNGFTFLVSLIVPVLPEIYFFLKYVNSIMRTEMDYIGWKVSPNYVPDRRFSEGYRQEGRKKEQVAYKLPVEEMKGSFNKKGVICLLLAIGFLAWHYWLFFKYWKVFG